MGIWKTLHIKSAIIESWENVWANNYRTSKAAGSHVFVYFNFYNGKSLLYIGGSLAGKAGFSVAHGNKRISK